MNIISKTLQNSSSSCSLIPFITAGYPTLQTTVDILYTLDSKGADIIELGIPYSDALADGPTIQDASKAAIKQGVHLDQILYLLRKVTPEITTPIVIFTYYNPILAVGTMSFISKISKSGVKGLVIPDLPLEEIDYVSQLCSSFKIELILFIAPTSSESRIISILAKSPGCIYLVSSNGVTGMGQQVDKQIGNLVKFIKNKTDKSIMLGFGIASTDQAYNVSQLNIDGIVVGSAFIRQISKSDNIALDVGVFCEKLKLAISSKL
uniref:Tryptophan synthase alpha chain n=2 Tax=Gelidium TaxID=2811 RepID=A0A411FSU7_9FLOR|nr:tryptophan synthase alpha subunit [Gelidium coulteri]YP_009565266.1 tryptophan synthase alpha subunit [Gelidium sinicola]QBA96217.1 tryptophan synthase alpha subunit [Gelidium coulteri]QBA96617.1 tryptophan synthase alpha subunit [Gelidium sinicola]